MARYSTSEIEQRIAKAKADGWKTLSLDKCKVQDQDLRELLTEPSIERLHSLMLYDNQLTLLPPEIGRLTALKMLYLFSNQLTMLPPEISRLTSLMTLSLGGNLLTTLPHEIGKLTTLTEFDLNFNQRSQPANSTSPRLLHLWKVR